MKGTTALPHLRHETWNIRIHSENTSTDSSAPVADRRTPGRESTIAKVGQEKQSSVYGLGLTLLDFHVGKPS
jgi:hypothetical protein